MHDRTCLFVPGNRPERFAKALATRADAVVLDLEDAVAPDGKASARDAIATWFTETSPALRRRVVVRINDSGSRFFDDDLALLRQVGHDRLMLAKSESADMIRAVRSVVEGASVSALIESARGILAVDEIADAPGVERLIFGTLDFAVDLDIDISDTSEALTFGAARLALASRVAGLPPPVAGVTSQLDDEARLLGDLRWERRHGFGAKLCIHPRQVDVVHAFMRPSDADVAWARRVIEADASSPGAARLDGRMIDRPVVIRAERALARAAAET